MAATAMAATAMAATAVAATAAAVVAAPGGGPTRRRVPQLAGGRLDRHLLAYGIVGVLLGMLPMWNSPVFLAAAVVFAVLFLLLPNRAPLIAVAVGAGAVGLPQLLALRPPGLPNAGDYPAIHWGYTVENPTVVSVGAYLAFTFGPKLGLGLIALLVADRVQRAVFVAFTALVVVAFGVQFSVEVFANHKFLNVWLVVLNLFAAAGMVRLWRAGEERLSGAGQAAGSALAGTRRAAGEWRSGARAVGRLAGRALVLALAVVIAAGGLIDLMPIKNTGTVMVRLQGDRLFDWVVKETRPDDVFLTDLYVTHPILLAGRRIYYGWSYYAWSAGDPVGPREQTYRAILGGTDPAEVVRLLQREGIAYVAIDDGMRTRGFVQSLNEGLFAATFEAVFSDPDNHYGHLDIYRVPAAGAAVSPVAIPGPTPIPVSMQTGGRGANPGQFVDPRGIAVAPNGDVLVADAGNHRIQRFTADGTFIASTGGKGSQPGRFNEPGGVAVDSRGHIYVADTTNHRVQELDPSFRFISEWRGPATQFYGPRDLAIGSGDVLYVLDQGRARVVVRGPTGTVREFGSYGTGEGQLNGPTGIAVAGDRVYVADTDNARIVVFDARGSVLATWPIVEWQGKTLKYPDVVVGRDGSTVYASTMTSNTVLVLDSRGRRVGTLAATAPDTLASPAAMAGRSDGRLYVVNFETLRISLLTTTE
jgi:DNA-binding beta-propeller fold protein YncE